MPDLLVARAIAKFIAGALRCRTLFADSAIELMKALASTQIDALSPMQAFEFLRGWKEKYGR